MKEGWLLDSNKEWAYRFFRDDKSWARDPKVFCDLGKPLASEPPLLKTRRHLRRADAESLWKSLISQGWKPVKPLWGSLVDP